MMKVSKVIRILSTCDPNADVQTIFGSVQSILAHPEGPYMTVLSPKDAAADGLTVVPDPDDPDDLADMNRTSDMPPEEDPVSVLLDAADALRYSVDPRDGTQTVIGLQALKDAARDVRERIRRLLIKPAEDAKGGMQVAGKDPVSVPALLAAVAFFVRHGPQAKWQISVNSGIVGLITETEWTEFAESSPSGVEVSNAALAALVEFGLVAVIEPGVWKGRCYYLTSEGNDSLFAQSAQHPLNMAGWRLWSAAVARALLVFDMPAAERRELLAAFMNEAKGKPSEEVGVGLRLAQAGCAYLDDGDVRHLLALAREERGLFLEGLGLDMDLVQRPGGRRVLEYTPKTQRRLRRMLKLGWTWTWYYGVAQNPVSEAGA